jgi:hypothetical protein
LLGWIEADNEARHILAAEKGQRIRFRVGPHTRARRGIRACFRKRRPPKPSLPRRVVHYRPVCAEMIGQGAAR